MRYSSSDNSSLGCSIALLIVCGVLFVGAISGIVFSIDTVAYSHQENYTVRICGKESVSKGKSSNQYRVYTKDSTDSVQTFVVEDYTTFNGHKRWNSADEYGALKVGEAYTLRTYGWRIGFISTFPNIISHQQVAESPIPQC